MVKTDFDLILDPSLDKFKDECGVFGVYSKKIDKEKLANIKVGILKEINKLINGSTSNLSEVIDNVNHNGHKVNEVMKYYDLIWNHKLSK